MEERGIAFYAQERYREAIAVRLSLRERIKVRVDPKHETIAHLSALPFQTRRSRLYQIAARMALGETEQAQRLARAALPLQPDLSTKYVREQEWYRDNAVLEKLMQRLVEAGVRAGINIASLLIGFGYAAC